MRKQGKAQINWWVQNMQHLPRAPVPHADEGFTEFPAGRNMGIGTCPKFLEDMDGVNILS